MFVSCSSLFDFDCMSLAVSDCILVQVVKKREEKEKERRGRRGDGQRALGLALGSFWHWSAAERAEKVFIDLEVFIYS